MPYCKVQKLQWDTYATIEYARKEGYKIGLKEAYKKRLEECKTDFLKYLLPNEKLSAAELAEIFEVPEAFVQKIKDSLP